MKDHEDFPIIPLVRGEGAKLFDTQGKSYIDAISSWWVNLFGHAHPHIVSAIAKQASSLEHAIFAGFTHEPAVRLAERLATMTGLPRLFFADNGSAAVEIALKLAYHYFHNQGQERPYFVSLTGSYHGETMGALAVGDLGLYKEAYKALLMRTLQSPAPKDRTIEAAIEAAEAMARLLHERGHEVAAVIVEPLVQCAGGMAMHDPEFIRRVRALCDQFGIFLIHDEIAVGFGRTGTMFAFEQAGIKPDLLCLSKGLTGGFLPMSVVMMREEIYVAFYEDYHPQRSFLHSHSYTGNPLACAAANATLDLFEEEEWITRNRQTAQKMAELLTPLVHHRKVREVRSKGMIAAVELHDLSDPRPARTMMRKALLQGVLLRPLGNVLYLMPPYVISDEELVKCVEVMKMVIDEVE
ncbi:MAG: adenosylmethionine--8-amino-7-oxononanoate transaminase [Campylobacterales bacterium]